MAALGGLALAGWASAAEPGKATLLGESSQRVAIVNHKYERATLIVPTGTAVTWINKDEHVHPLWRPTLSRRGDPLNQGGCDEVMAQF